MRSALLAALVAGCAAPAAYRGLPEQDRAAFEACASFVEQRACSQHADSLVRQFCLSGVAEKYGALRTPEERRAFLVEAGCPSSLVSR